MPEFKGLVTKACDILSSRTLVWSALCVSPENVLAAPGRGWGWKGLVSRVEVQRRPCPAGAWVVKQWVWGGWGCSNPRLGRAPLGSGLRSPLSQAGNFRDSINTHPGISKYRVFCV